MTINPIVRSLHGANLFGLSKDNNVVAPQATKMEFADEKELEILEGLSVSALGALTIGSKVVIPAPAVGTVAGTGVTVVESGNGIVNKTTITLAATVFALTDEAGQIAHTGLKIYDMPAGTILVLGAVTDLTVEKSSAGVDDDFNGVFSIGTVVASNNTTLTGTEANILQSTAMPEASSGETTAKGGAANALTALTDNSTGTANDTIAEITQTANAGSADLAPVENAIATLAGKVNDLIAAITGVKLLKFDGTTTAADVYLNFLVDDADHDVTSTPANLVVSGTVTLHWVNLGDY